VKSGLHLPSILGTTLADSAWRRSPLLHQWTLVSVTVDKMHPCLQDALCEPWALWSGTSWSSPGSLQSKLGALSPVWCLQRVLLAPGLHHKDAALPRGHHFASLCFCPLSSPEEKQLWDNTNESFRGTRRSPGLDALRQRGHLCSTQDTCPVAHTLRHSPQPISRSIQTP
jgi:hypothetical protein